MFPGPAREISFAIRDELRRVSYFPRDDHGPKSLELTLHAELVRNETAEKFLENIHVSWISKARLVLRSYPSTANASCNNYSTRVDINTNCLLTRQTLVHIRITNLGFRIISCTKFELCRHFATAYLFARICWSCKRVVSL